MHADERRRIRLADAADAEVRAANRRAADRRRTSDR
jgi:hypothetical protein